MRQSDDFPGVEQMDYDTWRDLLRPLCGRYNVEGVEPNTFAGWLRPLSVSGLRAIDICGNDFGPAEAASEVGISLRYLQKLFTQCGSTCTEFIYSLRLDHAARLLDRRTLLAASEPISTIAYDCGFRDYTHFARKFRHRFGYSPGAHCAAQDRAGTAG